MTSWSQRILNAKPLKAATAKRSFFNGLNPLIILWRALCDDLKKTQSLNQLICTCMRRNLDTSLSVHTFRIVGPLDASGLDLTAFLRSLFCNPTVLRALQVCVVRCIKLINLSRRTCSYIHVSISLMFLIICYQ